MENINIHGAVASLRKLASEAEKFYRELTRLENALEKPVADIDLQGNATVTLYDGATGAIRESIGLPLPTATVMTALRQRRSELRERVQHINEIITAAMQAGLSVPEDVGDANDLPF